MKVISIFIFLFACASNEPKVTDPIQLATAAKKKDLDQCYYESDTYMNRAPMALTYKYVINPEGKTVDHKILEQSPKDANFSACFTMVMKSIAFERPIQGYEVNGVSTPDPGGLLEIKQPFKFQKKIQ